VNDKTLEDKDIASSIVTSTIPEILTWIFFHASDIAKLLTLTAKMKSVHYAFAVLLVRV
jgi:hypothetical protein